MKESGGRRKERHHLVCVQVLIFLHLLSRKLLVHTHAISQHDVDQFPTSVRLIVEVAARGGRQQSLYLMIFLIVVPTASPIGILHLIRVPPWVIFFVSVPEYVSIILL